MKHLSLLTVLLLLLFLTACGSKPKNLICSGMTTSRLVEKYGEPVRKESPEDGSETWIYKAQRIVKSTSQEEWNTDTASPLFSAEHGTQEVHRALNRFLEPVSDFGGSRGVDSERGGGEVSIG